MNIIFSIYDKTFFQIIFTMLNSFQLNIVKISEITHFYKITEEKKNLITLKKTSQKTSFTKDAQFDMLFEIIT